MGTGIIESAEFCPGACETVEVDFPLYDEEGKVDLNDIRERCGYKRLTRCKVCSHSLREEIEQALMTHPSRWVGKKYNIGHTALLSHMKNHFKISE